MTKKKDTTPNLPAAFPLTEPEAAAVAKYTAEGFIPTGRRRYPVLMAASDAKIVELGEMAARVDADLRVIRQGKNAKAAELQREKKEREGAMHALSARILTKKDERGKPLDLASRAEYTRLQAASRKEFDEWETERKATLKSLADEVSAQEKAHGDLCKTITEGKVPEHATVLDLTDFKSSTVVSVRADTGEEVGRRALEEHERQAVLFGDLSSAGALTDHEYALCVAGRSAEAIESYAKRHDGMGLMKARVIVVGLIKRNDDDELPPEAGEQVDP